MTRLDHKLKWRPVSTAPENKQVRVRLRDGYGTFTIKTAVIFKGGKWFSSKTGEPIVATVINWQPYHKVGGTNE